MNPVINLAQSPAELLRRIEELEKKLTALEKPKWINLEPHLENSWVWTGAGSKPEYTKIGPVVFVRGRVKGGNASTRVCPLPYAPEANANSEYFSVVQGGLGAITAVVLYENGELYVYSSVAGVVPDVSLGLLFIARA